MLFMPGPRRGNHTKHLHVMVTPQEHAAAEWIAGRRGVTMAHVVREAIRRAYREEYAVAVRGADSMCEHMMKDEPK